MKRMRIVGLCLVAAFALSAIGAGSASALPEVGRCVSKAGGKYLTASCTTKGKGTFEFVKGAVLKKFTATAGEGKLYGATKTEIKCATQTTVGEYAEVSGSIKGVKKVEAKFNGCEYALLGVPCQTKGAASGEILTTKLKGALEYVGTGKKAGVALTPEVKKKGFTLFECPAAGAEVYVGEGPGKGHETVLAEIGPANVMATTSTESFQMTAKPGEQLPDTKEGSAIIDNLESSLSGPKGTFERSAQIQEVTQVTEEELDLKA